MAIVKNTIKQAIKQLATNMAANEEGLSQEESIDRYASDLAGIIVQAILSADVNPGIPVSTTGSPTAQAGATTAPGSLS